MLDAVYSTALVADVFEQDLEQHDAVPSDRIDVRREGIVNYMVDVNQIV